MDAEIRPDNDVGTTTGKSLLQCFCEWPHRKADSDKILVLLFDSFKFNKHPIPNIYVINGLNL